jgi:succinate dehydrogenase/fumarate reductase flavoprotein subunit
LVDDTPYQGRLTSLNIIWKRVRMLEAPILIVSGGAAGLAAAGALKHHGLDSVILDRDSKTGESAQSL